MIRSLLQRSVWRDEEEVDVERLVQHDQSVAMLRILQLGQDQAALHSLAVFGRQRQRDHLIRIASASLQKIANGRRHQGCRGRFPDDGVLLGHDFFVDVDLLRCHDLAGKRNQTSDGQKQKPMSQEKNGIDFSC